MSNPGDYPKRLIEADLPIARISAHARREKSIRHGHISTLHIWWARRPLAACRAVICAALWPDPADEHCPQSFRDTAARHLVAFAKRVNPEKITDEKRQLQESLSPESRERWEAFAKGDPPLDPTDHDHQNLLRFALLDFIADFANWDNSTVPAYLETSRALTQAAHEALGGELGTRPLVVDPFAGGGSIPLEALRVGADTFASDLNPVAVLLNKVVLEYTPKYGKTLADDIRKWGNWIRERAKSELRDCYPDLDDGLTPIAFFWSRTIISEAPSEGDISVEVPLLRSMWLAKKRDRRVALRWKRDGSGKVVCIERTIKYADGIIRKVKRPQLEIFEPQNNDEIDAGTTRGGAATCPVTGFTTPVEAVRRQLAGRHGGTEDCRLVTIAATTAAGTGRIYLIPEKDHELNEQVAAKLASIQQSVPGSPALIPTEGINHLRGFFNVVLYGMTSWGDLFTPRQKLILLTLTRLIKEVGTILDSSDHQYAEALQTCLALVIGRMADGNSSLASWQNTGEKIGHTFGRQALPMIWDFAEANPFCSATRNLDSMFEWVAKVPEKECSISGRGTAEQASATAHPLPNESVDAVVTDPPYYSAIPYADLSDFFYCWLTRVIRDRHPSLLKEDVSPKQEECVALSHRAAMYRNKDGPWFERQMKAACEEARRITKDGGVGVFVFASKETAAWEAMLQAVIDAGWMVTGSWPVDTEMGTRLRAMNSATLASSIHISARPRPTNAVGMVGDWRDILAELPIRMHEWMPRLASEGVVGADAIFACLGPALEIFSRYYRVEKTNGEVVPLSDVRDDQGRVVKEGYLTHVWAAVSKEALSTIFRDADASGLEPDARLTAMWLWTIGGGAPAANGKLFDDGEAEDEGVEDKDEGNNKPATASGFTLEFDAARKIAQGLGIHLERSESIVEVKGDKARLRPATERKKHLFGKDSESNPTSGKKAKKKPKQRSLFEELDEVEEGDGGWKELKGPPPGTTVLDRLHQAMILFGAQRGELLKRFLVEDGVGKDARFWKLAQSLAALYPPGTDERRWVEGVLARKKGLGL